MRERELKWKNEYLEMRNEMLRQYRPNSKILKKYNNVQTTMFDFIDDEAK